MNKTIDNRCKQTASQSGSFFQMGIKFLNIMGGYIITNMFRIELYSFNFYLLKIYN